MTYRDNIKAIIETNFIGLSEEYIEGVCAKICEIQPTEKTYEDGLNDAWEVARKLVHPVNGGYTDAEKKIIFDNLTSDSILLNFTASEAIAKIKAYEEQKNKIKQWDEVIIKRSSFGFNGHKGIVTKILGDNLFEVMLSYGTTYNYDTSNLEKTGKSYPELANILEQLKGDKE